MALRDSPISAPELDFIGTAFNDPRRDASLGHPHCCYEPGTVNQATASLAFVAIQLTQLGPMCINR